MKFNVFLPTFFVALTCFGHEGHQHAEPSQLTPLYGGSLVEASHDHHKSGQHNHAKASAREFFFEVVYSRKSYKLYWLQLANDSKTKLEQIKDLSKFEIIRVIQINPRKKRQTKILTVSKSDDHWLLTPAKIRGKRVLIKIEGKFGGENYIGTTQVERR